MNILGEPKNLSHLWSVKGVIIQTAMMLSDPILRCFVLFSLQTWSHRQNLVSIISKDSSFFRKVRLM